jgi:hypothetical protein
MIKPDDETAMYKRAVKIWMRRCKDGGFFYRQPAEDSTDFLADGTVILRNCNGVLARVEPPRK